MQFQYLLLILKLYFANPTEKENILAIEQKHGAGLLAKAIAVESTHINLFVGKKINPAHQNPNMPEELNIRMRLIDDLQKVLLDAGKIVTVKYY